ncbi:MAG TPA: hypothetical protein VGU90_03810 [Terriglobales bacterium]|nr:hypothetical protein [Terriglobales bacterium]
MKSLNTKLVLSALSVIAMLNSHALAQTPHRQPSQQQMDPAPRSSRGIYNMVPTPYAASPYDPAAVGGGSFGYNQSLHDNNW